MKKVLLTFGIALFGFTAAFAQDMGQPQDQDVTDPQDPQTEQQDAPADIYQGGEREQLDEASLPTAVSDALETGAYSSMTVSDVYKVKDEETGSKLYEVHLESEDGQATVVNFNEEGEIQETEEPQY
jgi:hypothetical protein